MQASASNAFNKANHDWDKERYCIFKLKELNHPSIRVHTSKKELKRATRAHSSAPHSKWLRGH